MELISYQYLYIEALNWAQVLEFSYALRIRLVASSVVPRNERQAVRGFKL
jgi:hypothetical protein